jgi:NAD(P)-dependent dehydrogenase (short-subunit alcohol dehydrogenase family)
MNDLERSPLALVTGANRGIGLEVVRQLAQQGMTVILGSRDLEKGQTAAERFSGEGLTVLPQPLDVTDPRSIAHLVNWVEQEFGYLNILVNNAGILYDTWQTASTADLAVVQEGDPNQHSGTLADVPSVYSASASCPLGTHRQCL